MLVKHVDSFDQGKKNRYYKLIFLSHNPKTKPIAIIFYIVV